MIYRFRLSVNMSIKVLLSLIFTLYLSSVCYAQPAAPNIAPEAVYTPANITLPDTGSTEEANEAADDNQQMSQETEREPQQYYTVEIILFRHLNEQGLTEEFWSRPKPEIDNTLMDTATIDDPSLLSHPQAIDANQIPVQDNSLHKKTYQEDPLQNSLQNNHAPLTDSQLSAQEMPLIMTEPEALGEFDLINNTFTLLSQEIAALPEERYMLKDAAGHLNYSQDFQLLAHFGWAQLPLSQEDALPILFNAEPFAQELIPNGEIKLYVSRYLHFKVDLATTVCQSIDAKEDETLTDRKLDEQLMAGQSPIEQTQTTVQTDPFNQSLTYVDQNESCIEQVYRFKQKRKMRSKELHYLDNPVFGMLIYVTPFTVTETIEEKTSIL